MPKPSSPQLPAANSLRSARDAALITRAQLSMQCAELAATDSARYVTISISAIRDLEVERTKPRLTTAVTLAAALQSTVDQLFPEGIDTPIRNPAGNTRIAANRPRGGRPRKKESS